MLASLLLLKVDMDLRVFTATMKSFYRILLSLLLLEISLNQNTIA